MKKQMQVNTSDDLSLSQKLDLMLNSGFLPKSVDTKAKAFVIMQTGKELGLEPMSSFKNIFVVNGSPMLSSDLKLAMIHRKCPQAEVQITEMSDTKCEILARRSKDLDMVEFSYSIEDAEKAGLVARNKNYQLQPKTMLRKRCIAAMASSVFPDIFMGFSEDNLEDYQGENNEEGETSIRNVHSVEGGDQKEFKKGDSVARPDSSEDLG